MYCTSLHIPQLCGSLGIFFLAVKHRNQQKTKIFYYTITLIQFLFKSYSDRMHIYNAEKNLLTDCSNMPAIGVANVLIEFKTFPKKNVC